MEEGLVALQAVGDWGRLECQRHICEIQGTSCLIPESCPPDSVL